MALSPTASAYIRAHFPFWAKRWAASLIFTFIVVAAFRINNPEQLWAALGAAAFALMLAFVVIVVALAIAGVLHSRGYVAPSWLTKDRGAFASVAAFAVGLLLVGAISSLYGM